MQREFYQHKMSRSLCKYSVCTGREMEAFSLNVRGSPILSSLNKGVYSGGDSGGSGGLDLEPRVSGVETGGGRVSF